jgi:hypothetical protein
MANASLKSSPIQTDGAHENADRAAQGAPLFRIAADGTWFYRGSAIQRPEMVKLFATTLCREGDGFMLVTPYERHVVAVDDAPFIAVAMRVEPMRGEHGGVAQRMIFTTNVEHEVVLSSEHPLIVRGTRNVPRPYVVVSPGLEAKIARSVYYELAVLAERRDDAAGSPMGVTSAGAFFALEAPMTPA